MPLIRTAFVIGALMFAASVDAIVARPDAKAANLGPAISLETLTELSNDYYNRRQAVDFGIPLLTNIQVANRLAETLSKKNLDDLKIKELQAY